MTLIELRKKRADNFFENAKNVWGEDKFIWDVSSYKSVEHKVRIFCVKHQHWFTQMPPNHLAGKYGCAYCIKEEHLKPFKDLFLKDAQKVWGMDTLIWDMDSYLGHNKDMNIYCIKHNNWFRQRPVVNLRHSCGCKQCIAENRCNDNTFIQRAKAVWGETTLEWDIRSYIKNDIKMNIKCIEHNHWFKQTPSGNLTGATGCELCKAENKEKTRIKNFNKFKKDAIKVHKNHYKYKLENYKEQRVKMKIWCNVCNKEITVITSSHLKGHGCNTCGKKSFTEKMRKSQEQYIADVVNIYGDYYDLSKVIYTGLSSNVIIGCPIHGFHEREASKILKSGGCEYCAQEHFFGGLNPVTIERHKEKYLKTRGRCYVIRCWNDNEEFYKIGITVKKIEWRFSGNFVLPYNYEVIHDELTNVYTSFYIEQYLHKILVLKSYTPKLKFGGYTECFSEILPMKEIKNHIRDVKQFIKEGIQKRCLSFKYQID